MKLLLPGENGTFVADAFIDLRLDDPGNYQATFDLLEGNWRMETFKTITENIHVG